MAVMPPESSCEPFKSCPACRSPITPEECSPPSGVRLRWEKEKRRPVGLIQQVVRGFEDAMWQEPQFLAEMGEH